jgi:hypothetical protein
MQTILSATKARDVLVPGVVNLLERKADQLLVLCWALTPYILVEFVGFKPYIYIYTESLHLHFFTVNNMNAEFII